MPTISVIVPIYNAEKYLHKCIDSILSQTFTDFELLLLDDGATDKSGDICDEFSQGDNRIKVIHKSNTGVSDTRNQGLNVAKGKYVIFMDADDYWFVDSALEQLVEKAEKYNLDIVRGEYKAVDKDGNELFKPIFTKAKQKLANQILASGEFYVEIMNGENFLWFSLFKKEAIGNIRFNEKRSFLEDMEFYAELLLQPLCCMFLPICFYAYRKNNESVSNMFKVKHLLDSFSMMDVFDGYASITKDILLKESYRYNSIMMYYWTLETMSQNPYYKNRLNLIKDLYLEKLNKKVLKWVHSTKKIYPLPIYMSPILGIYYFRLKHTIGCLFRKLIKF